MCDIPQIQLYDLPIFILFSLTHFWQLNDMDWDRKYFFISVHACVHKKKIMESVMESHFIINMSFNCQNSKKHDFFQLQHFFTIIYTVQFLQLKKQSYRTQIHNSSEPDCMYGCKFG